MPFDVNFYILKPLYALGAQPDSPKKLKEAVHFYITSDDLLSDCLNQLEAR